MDPRKSRRSPPPMAAGVATVLTQQPAASYRSSANAPSTTHSAGTHRLLLRVYAAEKLRNVSSHGTYCKVYVGNVDMAASRKGRQSFKKFLLASTLSSSSSSSIASTPSSSFSSSSCSSSLSPSDVLEPIESLTDQENNNCVMRNSTRGLDTTGARVCAFKTQIHKFSRVSPVWNEKFEVPTVSAACDVVSIRVKSARLMSSPAVGACCFALRDVVEDTTVDRWIDLLDGKKPAGRIRVQFRLVALASYKPAPSTAVAAVGNITTTTNAVRHRQRSGDNSSDQRRSNQTDLNDPATGNNNNNNNNTTTSPIQQQQLQRTSSKRSSSSANDSVSTTASDDTFIGDLDHVSETTLSASSSSSTTSTTTAAVTTCETHSQRALRSHATGAFPEPSTLSLPTTTMDVYADVLEFTDDETDTIERTLMPSYDTYKRSTRVVGIDRGTMLSDMIVLPRPHGSFVGSLHLYNRNSIATSTPSRTTVVLSEAEILALSRDSALAGTNTKRARRRRSRDGSCVAVASNGWTASNATASDGEIDDVEEEDVDDDVSDDSDDESDEEPETEGPRIPWSASITQLLSRKSANILFDEDDDGFDDDDELESVEEEDDDDDGMVYSFGSLDVVPIMDFPGTPQFIDEIDCA